MNVEQNKIYLLSACERLTSTSRTNCLAQNFPGAIYKRYPTERTNAKRCNFHLVTAVMVAVILAEAGGQISCGWSPLRSTNELRD